MIKDKDGNKVSALIKAKLELASYLDKFNLETECSDYSDLKRTEPDKVNMQIVKLMDRMKKAVIIK